MDSYFCHKNEVVCDYIFELFNMFQLQQNLCLSYCFVSQHCVADPAKSKKQKKRSNMDVDKLVRDNKSLM